MPRSVAVGKLEVRDRKSELPTCLYSDQLGTLKLGSSRKMDRIDRICCLLLLCWMRMSTNILLLFLMKANAAYSLLTFAPEGNRYVSYLIVKFC